MVTLFFTSTWNQWSLNIPALLPPHTRTVIDKAQHMASLWFDLRTFWLLILYCVDRGLKDGSLGCSEQGRVPCSWFSRLRLRLRLWLPPAPCTCSCSQASVLWCTFIPLGLCAKISSLFHKPSRFITATEQQLTQCFSVQQKTNLNMGFVGVLYNVSPLSGIVMETPIATSQPTDCSF